MRLKVWRDRVEELLFPRRLNCIFCGEPRRTDRARGLCPRCLEQLEKARVPASSCPRCLSYMPRGGPCPVCRHGAMKQITACYAPYRYEPCTRSLIHSLKFGGSEDAVPLLAEGMAGSIAGRPFDFMIPVPLHRRRELERGFNQAEVLARRVGEICGLPAAKDALERARSTRRQSSLSRKARAGNVKGAFRVPEEAVPWIRGARILLVDDVRTTGHTAGACAKALTEAGAGSVSLLTACVVWDPMNKTPSKKRKT